MGRIGGIENDVGQAMCFTVINKKSSNPLARFQELSGSVIQSVLDDERAIP